MILAINFLNFTLSFHDVCLRPDLKPDYYIFLHLQKFYHAKTLQLGMAPYITTSSTL